MLASEQLIMAAGRGWGAATEKRAKSSEMKPPSCTWLIVLTRFVEEERVESFWSMEKKRKKWGVARRRMLPLASTHPESACSTAHI